MLTLTRVRNRACDFQLLAVLSGPLRNQTIARLGRKVEPDASDKVCFCRAPSEAQRASAGKLCNEMIEVFSFTDVRKIVEQT